MQANCIEQITQLCPTFVAGGSTKENLLSQHRSLPKSFRSGFIGCLRNFRINGQPLRLQEDVLNRPGFSICENR